jgi:hypothetical protein
MLPTKTAKAKVLSIQASLSKDKKSSIVDSTDEEKTKSFKIKIPKTVPLKSDKSTFFENSAKAIASSGGRRERAESSIVTP